MATLSPAQEFNALLALANAGDAAAQHRVSQMFAANGDAARAQEWLNKSIAQGYAPARGDRGLAARARLAMKDAIADLQAAAGTNYGPALLGLAGLAATDTSPGLGGWGGGMALLARSAQAGDKNAWREAALLAGMAGDAAMSNAMLSHAAASGDGSAAYLALMRHERGQLALDADRQRAYRAALRRIRFPLPVPGEAADGIPFPAAGSAPPIDWPAFLDLVREPPGLSIATPERLSTAPDIWIARGFMSHETCDYAIVSSAQALAPARVVDPVSGVGRVDPLRTNLAAAEATAWMMPVKAALARRLASLAQMRLAQAEHAGLLCYRPGEEYRPHFDWLGPGQAMGQGGQRIKTALVYLNDGYAGGQTRFLTPGLDIPVAKGDAVLFRNTTDDGQPDMTTRHAGLPVTQGVKFLWSQWYRERDFMPLTQ